MNAEIQIEVELRRGDRHRHVWVDDHPSLVAGVQLRLEGEDELWEVLEIFGSRSVPVCEGIAC